jgi:phosphoserine aminotransferase
MDRVYNFSAGPSCLPLPVLNRVQHDLVNYPGAGCSVLEMSHRSRPFEEIAQRAQDSLRRLMAIGPEYSVLFLQGGASLQFSMIPMNLARRGQTVNYAVTGHFARLAAKEAERWSNVVTGTTGAGENYARIPKLTPDMLSRDAAYLHITGNNTIFGTAYHDIPQTHDIPLVADLSSIITGKVYDVRDFALIYAGAQKNWPRRG